MSMFDRQAVPDVHYAQRRLIAVLTQATMTDRLADMWHRHHCGECSLH